MTQGIPRRNSLYFQLLLLLLFSMLAAVGVFYGVDRIGEEMVYDYYVSSDYSERKDELYVSRLQEYVSQEKLSTSDVLALSKWMDKEKVLSSMLVFKDDILVYDSDYPEELNIRNEKFPRIITGGMRFILYSFQMGRQKFPSQESMIISCTII